MYGCESWTIKKTECQRLDAFELWYWRRFLKVPWITSRSNQSIIKEISSKLEGLIPKLNPITLATWCKELTHWKRPWCWKRLKVGEGDDRGWDGWMASQTRWIWVWASSGSWWWTGKPGVLQSVGLQGVGQDWATELNKAFESKFSAKWGHDLQPTWLSWEHKRWQAHREHSVNASCASPTEVTRGAAFASGLSSKSTSRSPLQSLKSLPSGWGHSAEGWSWPLPS